MSQLSNFFANTISGNQRAIEDALAAVGKEIKAIENWMSQNQTNSDNSARVIVGKKQIESDPLIYEKAYNLIFRLQDNLEMKWDDTTGVELHKTSVDFLVLKFVLAAGMGLQFNQAHSQSYPITAKLASLDIPTLDSYFQESFDDTEQLYIKYF